MSDSNIGCTHLRQAGQALCCGAAGVAGIARWPMQPGGSRPRQVAAPGELPGEGWLPALHAERSQLKIRC